MLWTTEVDDLRYRARLTGVPSYATDFGPTPFTVNDARRIGITVKQLRRLLDAGLVRRCLRGTYVDAVVPDGLEIRAHAAALVVPADGVVCLRTAAWLWGVDASAFGAHLVVPPVDVMRPAGRSAIRRRAMVGGTGPLLEDDIVPLNGLIVTTPARTTADLLRLLARPDALAAADAMARLRGVDEQSVTDVLSRFSRYRGVVQARQLCRRMDARAESPMESRTRLRALDAGFPEFEPQVEVFDALGAFIARLDLGRREQWRGLEYDGDEGHGRGQGAHDLSRRKRVEDVGWKLMVVTGEQVLGRGLAFEHGVAELLGVEPRLTRYHPRYGGWDLPFQARPWAA